MGIKEITMGMCDFIRRETFSRRVDMKAYHLSHDDTHDDVVATRETLTHSGCSRSSPKVPEQEQDGPGIQSRGDEKDEKHPVVVFSDTIPDEWTATSRTREEIVVG